MFWYHQGQQQPPHRLSDARSDVKGRTLLRRIRSGYTVISPSRKAGSQSPQPEEQQQQQQHRQPVPLTEVERFSSFSSSSVEEEAAQHHQQQERLSTPPEYEADDPPPYAQPLAPTLPGYTPIPGAGAGDEPTTVDLKQPLQTAPQRRRYRDVLKRRISSTRKLFSGDRSSFDGSDDGFSVDGEDDDDDDESARGVVLYRENGRWVGAADDAKGGEGEGLAEPRQRGFKGWLKRTWKRFMKFSDEHPYLFVLAVLLIVIIVACVLI